MEHHGEGCEHIPPVVIHLETEGKQTSYSIMIFWKFYPFIFSDDFIVVCLRDSGDFFIIFFRFNVEIIRYIFPGGGYRDGDLTNLFQFFRTSASINR